MGVEVKDTGIDWVDRQIKEELNALQESKFDKEISIKYLKNLNKTSYSEMMENNSGATVAAVQILLKEMGYSSIGKIDGILKAKGSTTSRTMEAVKDFQRKNGLKDDGLPGPDTVNKLLEKYGNGSSGGGNNAGASVDNSQQTTPDKTQQTAPDKTQPKVTPEKVSQSPEMTLNDLKKLANYNVKNLGSFTANGFVFKKGVEKSDKKGKYIEINGKRIYELGKNKNGIYYDKWKCKEYFCLEFSQYKNGKREGRGTENWNDGEKHVVQYKNNVRAGQGTVTYANGHKYVGQWKDDVREGQGTYTWSNGDKYVGQWKNNRFWTGEQRNAQGRVIDRCRNGIRQNEELEAKRGLGKEHVREGRKR